MAETPVPVPTVAPFRLKEWYPEISDDLFARLKIFQDELQKHGKSQNLVSLKTLMIADALHFADCYIASKIIMNSNPSIGEVFDIGSGAGFPGLIFAAMFPKVKVNLVEYDQKKVEFLKNTSAAMRLQNIQILNVQLESLPENSIQFALTRGLANISKTILATRRQVKRGGVFYHLKSEEWGMEVAEIPTQLCSIWSPGLVGEYKLPVGGPKFSVVKTDKIA